MQGEQGILPVFAGMVPRGITPLTRKSYSPRIRGDGPVDKLAGKRLEGFSPYSRGWSPVVKLGGLSAVILPVFAGMVPAGGLSLDLETAFSPYSRGWSH